MKNADLTRRPIHKFRHCFMYERQYFELDIYDFWQDRATLELELRDETQPYSLPPEITLIRDVTEEKRYKNNHLAGVTNYEDY